jgi:hypothetical protein
MTNEKTNEQSPAFPPQVMQDSLGRIVVAVPGLSKLEYLAALFMQQYILLQLEKPLRINGQNCSASQAAIYSAKDLLSELKKLEKNENTLHITE